MMGRRDEGLAVSVILSCLVATETIAIFATVIVAKGFDMARIEPLQPPFEGRRGEDLKSIFGDRDPFILFTTIASSERAWKKFRGGSMLDTQLLTLREREIVIDRTCARTRCEWEWGVHVMVFAEQAGLTRDEVAETLRVPADLSCWSPKEAALVETIDALHDRSTLSDDEFARLAAHYSSDQILEIIQMTGQYHTISYLAAGLALPLEDGAARFIDYEPLV